MTGSAMHTVRAIARIGSRGVTRLQVDALLDRRNRKRGGCILAYHDVRAAQVEAHVESLLGRYEVVSLDELVDRKRRGRDTAGLLALTFDDGYRGTVLEAARLAQRRDWPMTFYLPTDLVGETRPFWFTELPELLRCLDRGAAGPRHLPLQVGDARIRLDAGESDATLAAQIERQLYYRRPEVIAGVMRDLRERVPDEAAARDAGPETVTWDDVARLARATTVTFGAHTATHPFLGALHDDEVREQLARSRDAIIAAVGEGEVHFCYPYGDARSIGPVAPRVAAGMFASAVTMMRGRCGPGTDLHMLPRIPLYDGDAVPMTRLKLALAA